MSESVSESKIEPGFQSGSNSSGMGSFRNASIASRLNSSILDEFVPTTQCPVLRAVSGAHRSTHPVSQLHLARQRGTTRIRTVFDRSENVGKDDPIVGNVLTVTVTSKVPARGTVNMSVRTSGSSAAVFGKR
jgi:hypothetical protein